MRKIIVKLIFFVYGHYHNFFGLLNSYVGWLFPLYPSLLRIRITSKCNLFCGFCYLQGSLNQKEDGLLKSEEWEKMLAKIPFYTIVDITGAEPTISPDLGRVIKILRDKGNKVSLTTNGMDTSDNFVNLIVENELTFLMISIDDFPEKHNEVRGNKRSFDNIKVLIEKINRKKNELGKKRPIINLKTTILDDNANRLKDIYEFYQNEFDVDNHTFNLGFNNQARGGVISLKEPEKILSLENTFQYEKSSEITEPNSGFQNFLKSFKGDFKVRPQVPFEEIKDYIAMPGSYGVKNCFRSKSVMTINFDGTLSFCDINYQYTNIRDIDYDLKRAWAKPNFKTFQKLLKRSFPYPSPCEGCCLAKHEKKA